MEGERATSFRSKRRSTTPDLKTTSESCIAPNYKINIQPISPGVSPIKKPKSLKTKKGTSWKSMHNELEKVKTQVYTANSKFIAKHKPTKEPTKNTKPEFMIKQCLFKEKIETKNPTKEDKQLCSITQDKNFKHHKFIDFKSFQIILENWGFEDTENYCYEYSEIDINSNNVSIVVKLVERSVHNYDLEDSKKTFRYLYCLMLDPASFDIVYTSSAMRETYLRLKNLDLSDDDIVSIIIRGKVPAEIAVNVISYLNNFDENFLLLYAKSASPLDSSLDFLKYLTNCDPDYYEMYLVYYVFKRVDAEYPVDVLKDIYSKLKQMQDKSPAILYSRFREECWKRLKPSLNVHEKKDLY